MSDSILNAAKSMRDQLDGRGAELRWDERQWLDVCARFVELASEEASPFLLGEVLRLDHDLALPVSVVKATYERLISLGAVDVHTRLAYARYLSLHGPDWDSEASSILQEIESTARAAGLWDNCQFGHHPVFYRPTSPQDTMSALGT